MDIFRALDISASGLNAHRQRMDVIAENLANADTTITATGRPYQRKTATLEAVDPSFPMALSRASTPAGGVRVSRVVESTEPGRRVYQPGHPQAGPDGFVDLPNVNPLQEMTDMMSTTRAYEANAASFQAAKTMATKLLDLLR